MVLPILSAIIGCLGGAMSIATAFKKESSETIVGHGRGDGFFKFYSHSLIGDRTIRMNLMEKYLDRIVSRIMRDQSPALQVHKQDILDEIMDTKDFESYTMKGESHMVNSVGYNKNVGQLFMNIYTFDPMTHEVYGPGCTIQYMKIQVDFNLAQDWMIVSKTKARFNKATQHQEFKYIDEKAVDMKDVVKAISIAVAPAVLGLVKLPESFMTCLDSVIKSQIENPSPELQISQEQLQASQQQFNDMVARQEKYMENVRSGFDKIAGELGKIGQPEPVANSRHYRHRRH